MTRPAPAPRPGPALLLRQPPDHGQGPAPRLGPQLPRHRAAVPGVHRGRQGLQDHPPDPHRPDLRPGGGVPAPPRARPGQPRQHPQPAAGRPALPVRLHRRAGTGDARHLPAGGRHPGQAHRPAGNPVPRTRRDRRPPAPPAPRRPARAAGPRPDPVPLQHRRPRARGRRPARRAPRPRRAPAGAPARQGRQMAHLPALAADSTAADHPARPGRAARARRAGVRRPRAAPHPLRHLQDHPPARRPLRRPAHRTADQPAHLPAHRRRPPARSRRRGQRDPRLARTWRWRCGALARSPSWRRSPSRK